MKIAICDDDIQELASIAATVESFQAEHCSTLTYEVFNSPKSLLNKVQTTSYDLLLLDVIMPEMTGLELATTIRTFNKKIPIIFLTSSPEFALASYRVHAKDYLLKPIDQALLYDALLQQMNTTVQTIVMKTTEGITQLTFNQIVYLEVVARKLNIYLIDGTVVQTLATLAEYEEKLLSFSQFYKPHRSYLINLQHVVTIDKDGIHTSLNNTIPIPKPNYAKTKNVYMTYLMQS